MDPNKDPPPHPLDLDFLDLAINEDKPTELNNLTLCGKLIADKTINFKSIKYILLRAWNSGPHIEITHMYPNQFVCTFSKEADKDRIFSLSPWAVKDTLLFSNHGHHPSLSRRSLSIFHHFRCKHTMYLSTS